MNPELQSLLEALSKMIRADPEGVAALCDWASRMGAREKERRLAAEEGRPPDLVSIALAEPDSGEDEPGIGVSGCSACAGTLEDRQCPGCGNPGLLPLGAPLSKKRPLKRRRSCVGEKKVSGKRRGSR